MEKINQREIKKKEYILALSFVLPYMEISIIRNAFGYSKNGIVIPASIFIMVALFIILTISIKLSSKRKYASKIRSVIYLKSILDIFIFMRGICVDDFSTFFAQFLWFIIPFYYAVAVIKYIDCFNLKVSNVGKMGLFYYAIYVVINIIVNIKYYGFAFSNTAERSRIISPGGGPVIFGYTIVIIICYLLYNKGIISSISMFIGILIYSVGGILTGSRAAIWPIILLLIIYIFMNKHTSVKIMTLSIVFIIVIILNPISFLTTLVPRIIDFSGGTRLETAINAFKIFYEQPVLRALFGSGFGNLFPYQLWLSSKEKVINLISYNTFIYDGRILLVQPHNSYLYLLLETGLIGLLLFLSLFINIIFIIKRHESNNKHYKYIMIFFIMVLNCFDSVFIIQPGTAGLWWLLIFMVITDTQDICNCKMNSRE